MKEIELSNGAYCKNKGKYIALVDDEDFERLNQIKWHAVKHGGTIYACTNSIVDELKVKQYMHREILNGKGIDHIDGNGCNNTRSNLRFCTRSENGMNRTKHKNMSSVYKGVCFHKKAEKWKASITINGKDMHLGLFDSEVEAAKAYNNKAIELFCEFANLNKF